MVYHNFTDFNVKINDNYNEVRYFKSSSIISGSHSFYPTHPSSLEMIFNFDVLLTVNLFLNVNYDRQT